MTKETNYFFGHDRELERKYAGRCIAVVDNKVVAVGADRLEVYKKAIRDIPKNKTIGIFYLPYKEEVLTALWSFHI